MTRSTPKDPLSYRLLALVALAAALFLGVTSVLFLATLVADLVGLAEAPREHWIGALVWLGPLIVMGGLFLLKWLYDHTGMILPSRLHAAVQAAPFGETRLYSMGVSAMLLCFLSGVLTRSTLSIAAAMWVMAVTFWLDGVVALGAGFRRHARGVSNDRTFRGGHLT